MNGTIARVSLGMALVLSACSGGSDDPEPSASNPATEPQVETVSRVGDGPPPPVPDMPSAAASSEAPLAASEIPEKIRGRWGLVPKDCTSQSGDAKGLLTISAGQLEFYESVAKLGKVKEAQDDRVRGTFAFSGEGQTWTLDVTLDLQDGGKTLIRRDHGKDALPEPLTYTRCS